MFSVISRPGGGFTFVELIFVILIIAVLAAAAAPRMMRSIDSLVLQNFISDMTAFAGYAQAKAVNLRSQVRLRFDSEGRLMADEVYVVSRDSLGNSTSAWNTDRQKRIPEGITVENSEGNEMIVFYPDGTCETAAFTVSGRTGRSFSVIVDPATGYVNAKETR